MDDRFPGDWHIENGALFKGKQKIEGSTEVVDALGNIETLNTVTHDIAHNMESVMDGSRIATDEAQNVSAATEQQAATMHDISDANNQLAKLAESLSAEVKKFKV